MTTLELIWITGTAVVVGILWVIVSKAADSAYATPIKTRPIVDAYLTIVDWSARVVPPFLLAPLFFVQFDVFTALYWGAGVSPVSVPCSAFRRSS